MCVRLIDVQMDSVRYTYVFGHPIYEPATSNQHLFSPKFPLFILALSACLLVISIRRKNFKIFSQSGNAHILLLQNSAASCRVNSYFFSLRLYFRDKSSRKVGKKTPNPACASNSRRLLFAKKKGFFSSNILLNFKK